MHGTRHDRVVPAGRSLLLLSLLALLAFTCFPVFAQADSSEVQYEVNPVPSGHSHQHEPVAKGSTQSGGTPSAPAGSEAAPSEVNSGGSSSGEVEAGSNNRPQRHQVSPAHAKSGGEKHAAKSPAHATNASPADEGSGSSSPLVPILIAIAALAAISIGVVLVRQRRQRPPGQGDLSTRTG
jgi:cobalamin biosynthesis Mg chelatase CobN